MRGNFLTVTRTLYHGIAPREVLLIATLTFRYLSLDRQQGREMLVPLNFLWHITLLTLHSVTPSSISESFPIYIWRWSYFVLRVESFLVWACINMYAWALSQRILRLEFRIHLKCTLSSKWYPLPGVIAEYRAFKHMRIFSFWENVIYFFFQEKSFRLELKTNNVEWEMSKWNSSYDWLYNVTVIF